MDDAFDDVFEPSLAEGLFETSSSAVIDSPTVIDLDDGISVPLLGFADLLTMSHQQRQEDETVYHSIVIKNSLTFGLDPYGLSMGGQTIINVPNAGGSSVLSEVFAYEVLFRCELAVLLKTETEIQYTTPNTKITDMIVEIDGQKIGVSVTRAVKYPRDNSTIYSDDKAIQLLTKKFMGINESSANVADDDRWDKQILHVLAYDEQHAQVLIGAHQRIEATIKRNTILWITVTRGMDEFIY